MSEIYPNMIPEKSGVDFIDRGPFVFKADWLVSHGRRSVDLTPNRRILNIVDPVLGLGIIRIVQLTEYDPRTGIWSWGRPLAYFNGSFGYDAEKVSAMAETMGVLATLINAMAAAVDTTIWPIEVHE